MKSLDVQARLEYARATVAVLRALQVSGGKMKYRQFAIAIGMMTEAEKWEVWHRTQITAILNLTAAAEKQGRSADARPLEFERIITGEGEGAPGKGFYKKAKIVTK